jgi:hypothetical protein
MFVSLSADKNHYAEGLSPTCGKLFKESLFLYGFIFKILTKSDNTNVKIEPKTGYEVNLLIEKLFPSGRPIFHIDECILTKDGSVGKLRFARNCFRSLGLGLVMLGTDFKAAQLPADIGNSSRYGDTRPWCYIFGSFPSVSLGLLKLPDRSLTSEWSFILSDSRPLFSQMLSETAAANNESSFDDFLKMCLKNLLKSKRFFKTIMDSLDKFEYFRMRIMLCQIITIRRLQ